ncbi:hypothetical protein [Thaumasiovibrio sp. DFM-14]|uniref:hypothetical protein n=1 Tax=Thaumasiovibrio sp. DFM-14 TaxID=3384792 RepID=UPI0039A1DF4A
MSQDIFSAGGKLRRSTDRLLQAAMAPIVEAPKAEMTEEVAEATFFESMNANDADDSMLEALAASAEQSLRREAAAAVTTWIEEGDADFYELEALLIGLVNDDEGSDLDEDEEDQVDELCRLAADFIVNCGADSDDVAEMFSNGNDDSAEAVFTAIDATLSGEDSDDMIADFGVREQVMAESKKKVIRNGKVAFKKKKRRKKRQTSAQKAALKKARRKAHTGAAKKARKKSMKLRKQRGM